MDYKQIMMRSANQYNAQEKAYQEKIASQNEYIHKMFEDVCNFVECLVGDNPNMEITKNEGGRQSGNYVLVKNKCNGYSLRINTPHTFIYGDFQIQFWVVRGMYGKGYYNNYDLYKESIADIMGHIL